MHMHTNDTNCAHKWWTHNAKIGHSFIHASCHPPLTEHQVYEICGLLFGGEEAKNVETEDDREEWWGLRDTQQGVGQDSPLHV